MQLYRIFNLFKSLRMVSLFSIFVGSDGGALPCGKHWLEINDSTLPNVAYKPIAEVVKDSIALGTSIDVAVSGDIYTRDATCRYVGEHSYIFVEDKMWDVVVVQQAIDQLGHIFDVSTPADSTRGVYELLEFTFGSVPDVDGFEKIFIFVVDLPGNELVGYFDSRISSHIDSRIRRDAVYIDANFLNSKPLLARATLAHEFQHLIHWGQDSDEEVWLDEGLSGYAELVVGYPEADPNMVPLFLSDPDLNLTKWPIGNSAIPHYGATYLFVTFLHEKYGSEFIRDLVVEPRNGIQAINAVLKTHGYVQNFSSIWGQWIVGNALPNHSEYGYKTLASRSSYTHVVQGLPLTTTGGKINQQWGALNVLLRSSGNVRITFDGGEDSGIVLWGYGMRGQLGDMISAQLDSNNLVTMEWVDIDSLKLIIGNTDRISEEFFLAADYYEPGPVPTAILSSFRKSSDVQSFVSCQPNPFNHSTSLTINLNNSAKAELVIFNMLGQRVRNIFYGRLSAGRHIFQWDGYNDDGRKVGSGRYFAVLGLPGRDEIRGLSLIK